MACEVLLYYPVPLAGTWVSHIAISLAKGMTNTGLPTRVAALTVNDEACRPLQTVAPNPWLVRACWKLKLDPRPLAERRVLRAVRKESIAYLWPGCSISLYERLKSLGVPIVSEMINCHEATSRKILEDVYRFEGHAFNVNDHDADLDDQRLALCDKVFVPSPLVEQSIRDRGTPPEKILRSSYGYDPLRINAVQRNFDEVPLNFLFLGSGILRKGVHLLLQAWNNAAPPGARLTIAGAIDPAITDRYRHVLSRDDVCALGQRSDVNEVLAAAHVFVFPTFEEGSPLVVYEALASGLPVVTTAMGAGEIVRDAQEGRVIRTGDVNAILEAVEWACTHREDLPELSQNAVRRAADFEWSKVAARRAAQIRSAFDV